MRLPVDDPDKMQSVRLSVVIPVYKAQPCLDELYRRLKSVLEKIAVSYEIILVEDCGNDGSWEIIEQVARTDARVRGIRLSRNFGQHYAITAGLDHVCADWVVVMDCDLQDRPEEIEKLYRKSQEGYDVVLARRHNRNDSLYRKLSSRFFSMLYNRLGDIKMDNATANFSISSRRVIDYVRQFRERNRSFPIFLNSVGFKRAYVDVQHAPRFAGKSSYSFSKLMDFAITCIVAQSNKPLRLAIRFGFFLAMMSLAYAACLMVRYFLYGSSVAGWTSLMVMLSFLFGLLFTHLGILGLYMGKVFDEVKQRPLYIVEKTVNVDAAKVNACQPTGPARGA